MKQRSIIWIAMMVFSLPIMAQTMACLSMQTTSTNRYMHFLSEQGQKKTYSSNVNKMLNLAGIQTTYYTSQGTAHEWLTRRHCLNEFIPLLFR